MKKEYETQRVAGFRQFVSNVNFEIENYVPCQDADVRSVVALDIVVLFVSVGEKGNDVQEQVWQVIQVVCSGDDDVVLVIVLDRETLKVSF